MLGSSVRTSTAASLLSEFVVSSHLALSDMSKSRTQAHDRQCGTKPLRTSADRRSSVLPDRGSSFGSSGERDRKAVEPEIAVVRCPALAPLDGPSIGDRARRDDLPGGQRGL